MNPDEHANSVFESAVKLDSVMDAMTESMIVINERGVIEQINAATLTMFGYSREELIGANISILMVGADQARHDRYLSRYRETQRKRIIGTGREVQAARQDGSLFPADIAVGEIRNSGTVRYVGLIRDLTEQRKTEEVALKQREEMVSVSRLSLMGEMAAAMAHELNQPLTAIANYSAASIRLLQTNKPENIALVSETLQDISDQALRAGEVISRTRAFTRSADSEKSATTLHQVNTQVRSLAELDANANNISLRWDIPADLPTLEVDPVQIQQVILNLIRNAVDATRDTAPDDRKIEIRARLSAPHEVRYEVRDHGGGVDPDVGDNVFNAFFTTKSLGMGMGLAICRTIIRNHGGELGYRNNDQNDLSQGSTFYFTLPTQLRAHRNHANE